MSLRSASRRIRNDRGSAIEKAVGEVVLDWRNGEDTPLAPLVEGSLEERNDMKMGRGIFTERGIGMTERIDNTPPPLS